LELVVPFSVVDEVVLSSSVVVLLVVVVVELQPTRVAIQMTPATNACKRLRLIFMIHFLRFSFFSPRFVKDSVTIIRNDLSFAKGQNLTLPLIFGLLKKIDYK
jgi:hypothetical protein